MSGGRLRKNPSQSRRAAENEARPLVRTIMRLAGPAALLMAAMVSPKSMRAFTRSRFQGEGWGEGPSGRITEVCMDWLRGQKNLRSPRPRSTLTCPWFRHGEGEGEDAA